MSAVRRAVLRPEPTGLSREALRDDGIRRLHGLRQALEAIKLRPDIRPLKTIADFASAQVHWAAKQQLGKDVENDGFAIKTEALALLGDVIKEGPKAEGTRGQLTTAGPGRGKTGGVKLSPPVSDVPTLKDQGVDKRTAKTARKLAALAPAELHAVIAREKTLAAVTREKKAVELEKRIALPDAKFFIVYADPPWSYNDKADAGAVQGKGAGHHYPTMSIQELCELPVEGICEPDAVLFLWVTSPLLAECFAVIKAWGFTYRACFVWDKVKHNMGHYNSVRHELLLICGRGSCAPKNPTLRDSVQVIERTGHSEKPEDFRAIIDDLYPTGRRVELFARGTPPAPWEGWGNEA